MVPVRRMRPATPPPAAVGDLARVPMALVDGIPVVPVTIGGRPYRFAIDTGAAGHGRIRASVAQALGLAAIGTMQAGDGSGAVQERRSYAATTLGLGNIRFDGVTLSEMGVYPGRFEGVDGILGRNLFGAHLLSIDYAAGEVRLSREALPAQAVSYQPGPNGMTVPLQVGDRLLPAVIDTGNTIAPLVLPTASAERLRSGEPRPAGQARTSVSTVEIFEADLAVPVLFGAARLPITRFRYPALGDVANLGSQAFASGTLVIDQVNNRIAFYPAEQRATR
jgi:predicted aspartyl protease